MKLAGEVFRAFFAGGLSLILALIVQVPALALFYGLVPGEKSTDGPILLVLAYVLTVPVSLVSYCVARYRGKSADGAFGLAAIPGPVLMLLCAAASAWAAVLPPR